MADTSIKFGHRSESLKDLARTLAFVVQGTESLDGGFYFGADVWSAIRRAFLSGSGKFENEMAAVQRFLEKVMDPKNPAHHNFVDCLYCPNCREAFCEKHSPDVYQPPTLQLQ